MLLDKLLKTIGCIYLITFVSCVNNEVKKIDNYMHGKLTATKTLVEVGEKKFSLDSCTAPKPNYIQFVEYANDTNNYITFFNTHNRSIYYFNYCTSSYEKRISFEVRGADGVGRVTGYHIKNNDSIYLYDASKISLNIANNKGEVIKRISLRNNNLSKNWEHLYPQYYPQTVTPFLETEDNLILNGFYFGVIPEDIINNFKYSVKISFDNSEIQFNNTYPEKLYGNSYNWDSEAYTTVYSDLHPDNNKIVVSYPISHDIFIYDFHGNLLETKFAGSNHSGTISSMEKYTKGKYTPNDIVVEHYKKQDVYTAIKYDKYRKIYYRFLLRTMANSSNKQHWKKKPIVIILYNEDFEYLGEKEIGNSKEWNWQNSFVTKEGLNIEHIDNVFDEVFLSFKIFNIKNI